MTFTITHRDGKEERGDRELAIIRAMELAHTGLQVWVAGPKREHVVYYDGRKTNVHIIGGSRIGRN